MGEREPRRARGAKVLIVGAGPTGLTLALWLTRLGIPVRIVDKLSAPQPYSRALGVQARTLELYRQLDSPNVDLAGEAVRGGLKVEGINFWTSGRRVARIPFGNIGQGQSPFPFVLTFAQDAHERMLIRHLEDFGVTVDRGLELLRFAQQGGKVRAVLMRDDKFEEREETDYLAGCDGARSAVREGAGITFEGGTYSRLFYVADVDAAGPAVDRDIHVELDKADLLAIFPMDGEHRVRLVGTMRDDAASNDGSPQFDDVSARAIDRLKLSVSKVNWFSTYRVHHRVAARFRAERAFLLGDAAHIHSPVGAQGMNTGIGDAVNLAWKLAAVLKGCAAEDLLDTYESERIAFARRLVKTTDRIFTFASRPGQLAERVRTTIFPLVVPLVFRVSPLRAYLYRVVSQLGIHYRGSALSSGRSGKVHGGDRLPWVAASHEDNYVFVSTLTWQAHVYGKPQPGVSEACESLALPLHVFRWTPEAERKGLKHDAVYVVRPDSYIALAGGGPQELREYFASRGLRVTGQEAASEHREPQPTVAAPSSR
jgi:2-polyprenyl-6-methoxyphenol hydroxylase-like FAD-dependent oxidoreductase